MSFSSINAAYRVTNILEHYVNLDIHCLLKGKGPFHQQLPPTGVYYITASKSSHFYIVFIPHLSNYQLQCFSIECHLPIRSLFANFCRVWSSYSTQWLQYAPNTKFDYILPPNSILVSMISFKLTCCPAGLCTNLVFIHLQKQLQNLDACCTCAKLVESTVTYI